MFDWLSVLLDPLTRVVFVVGHDNVTWAELLGFVTGGACVWLTVVARESNFPVGIANSALFLLLFTWASLWADASLQIVFIALGAIGWWQWRHGRVGDTGAIRWGSRAVVGGCAAFVIAATTGLTVLLRATHDAAPFWDALTTALSLAAQYLLNTKRVQTWWFWVAADVIYVPLYLVKDLYLTSLVYLLFLAMCVSGFAAWRRAAATSRAVTAAVAVAR